MRKTSLWIWVLTTAACVPSFGVPDGSQITCETDDECPGDWLCHPTLRRCREPGFDPSTLPGPEVLLMVPAAGATQVREDVVILLVLSEDVTVDALDTAATLVGDDDSAVPLTTRLVDGRTFELTPASLAFDTIYTFTVADTLESSSGARAPAAFTSTFTTRSPPDRVAPDAVSDVLLDASRNAGGEPTVTVSWTNPEEDFAGVLVLRREGAEVEETLVDQTPYEAGETLSGGATVVAKSTQTQLADILPNENAVHYAVVAFDSELNYATPAPAPTPYVTSTTLRWCPDTTARLRVSGPQAGELSALVSPDPTTLNLAQGQMWPATAQPVTEEITLPPEAFEVGTDTLIRVVVTTSAGTYVGRPLALTAHPGALTVTLEPPPVGPDAPRVSSSIRARGRRSMARWIPIFWRTPRPGPRSRRTPAAAWCGSSPVSRLAANIGFGRAPPSSTAGTHRGPRAARPTWATGSMSMLRRPPAARGTGRRPR